MSSQTTTVLGYFNRNNYAINISSDSLGINTQVGAKKYVEDRDGRKINDPRLDLYVKSGLLSKEFSAEPVECVYLAGVPPMGASGIAGVSALPMSPAPVKAIPAPKVPFSGHMNVEGDGREKPAGKMRLPVAQPTPPAPQQGQPITSAPSIRAMTVEQAQRAGLVAPTDKRDLMAKMPDEDQTGQAARSAPSISKLTPRMMAPVAVPPAVAQHLQTIDVSQVGALDEQDAVSSISRVVGQEAGVDLKVTPVLSTIAQTASKVVGAVTPTRKRGRQVSTVEVQFDGRTFKTKDKLLAAISKKFSGDQEMIEDAYAPYRAAFETVTA